MFHVSIVQVVFIVGTRHDPFYQAQPKPKLSWLRLALFQFDPATQQPPPKGKVLLETEQVSNKLRPIQELQSSVQAQAKLAVLALNPEACLTILFLFLSICSWACLLMIPVVSVMPGIQGRWQH